MTFNHTIASSNLASGTEKAYEVIAPGEDAKTVYPGDIILCHRKGFMSWCIRTGERLRFNSGSYWSHVAVCTSETDIVEALTHGVVRNKLSIYRDITYVVVHTQLSDYDVKQAMCFIDTCVGKEYGFGTDVGTALRFLTPGKGLWFGMNGTEICSGLAAQMLVRGWAIFPTNPSSMSPAELGIYYAVPSPRAAVT